MSRTLKENQIRVTEDEEENESTEESSSGSDEEAYESWEESSSFFPYKLLITIPSSGKKVNLPDDTEIRNNCQLKELQYGILKSYLRKMVRSTFKSILRKRFGENTSKKPKMIEDLPCECDVEKECKISENTEKGCKGDEKRQTKKDNTAEKSIKSPIQQLEKHTSTCNVKRLSLYFSWIAKYFIGEEVDPDMFLYIPFPVKDNGDDSVDYKYYILQENRRILILKLGEGLRIKLLSLYDMKGSDQFRYGYRNEFIIRASLALDTLLRDLVHPYCEYLYKKQNNEDGTDDSNRNQSNEKDDLIDDSSRSILLKAEFEGETEHATEESGSKRQKGADSEQETKLLKPYENFTNREENNVNDGNADESNQNPPKQTDDQIKEDKRIYRKLKAEYRSLKKRLKEEVFKRCTEKKMDEIIFPDIAPRDPSTSEDENEELDIEKRNDSEDSLSVDSDSEQATDETESERGNDLEKETEASESKRKKKDSDQETEEPECKRQKADNKKLK